MAGESFRFDPEEANIHAMIARSERSNIGGLGSALDMNGKGADRTEEVKEAERIKLKRIINVNQN